MLIILVPLFILLTAHIQTRRISPALPAPENIAALIAKPDGPISLSYVLTSSQLTSKGVLGHPVFIAQWADGHMFMIDIGMDKKGAEKFAELLKKMYGGKDPHIYGSALDLIGPTAANIQGIGFTHLHIDHTQGVGAFCAARAKNERPSIAAYLTQLQKSKHNFNTKEGAKIIRKSCLKDGHMNTGNIMSIDGFPGLSAVQLAGHTPGSTLYILNVDNHFWLLSGDIAATKMQLLDNHGKGFLYSYVMVPENTKQTEKLRLWLAGLDARGNMSVIVSHDLEALEKSGLKPFQPPN